MISHYADRRLKRLMTKGDPTGLPASDIKKILAILTRLNKAKSPEDMRQSGWRLHLLSNSNGLWSVRVNANDRIVFRFIGENAVDVEYIDYH